MRLLLLNLLLLSYRIEARSDQRVSTTPDTTTVESSTDEAREFHFKIREMTRKQQQAVADELRKNHPLCFSGDERSPVDITLSETVPIYVPGIEFVNFNVSGIVKDLTSDFRGEFVLWEYQQSYHHSYLTRNGMSNCGRIEHSIDEATYDFEGNFIHVKRGMTLEEAQGVPGAIVTVAVGFVILDWGEHRLEAEEPSLQKSLKKENDQIDAMRENKTQATVKMQPMEFIPNDTTNFFTYTGSLAYTPCSRGVTWFILAQPVELPYKKIYSSFFQQFKLNKLVQLVNKQSLGSRIVYFNYGEQRKPAVVQDEGYPMYVLVLVTLIMVASTCAGNYAYTKYRVEKPNAVHNLTNHVDDSDDRTMLVDSELVFSL